MFPLSQSLLAASIQLADSEMLCKEGRQDFDLTTAGFADDDDLGLCLSDLIPWMEFIVQFSINTN